MELCFNNFLNEYLRLFNHSFPLKKILQQTYKSRLANQRN